MKKIYKIEGLDCANCALELEEELNKIEGVSCASVSFIGQKVEVDYDLDIENKIKDTINNFEEVKIIEDNVEKENHIFGYDFYLLLISFVIGVITFILTKTINNYKALLIIEYVGYLSAYLIIGHEVLISMFKNIFKGNIFDENFLMGIASIGAILISIFSSDNYLSEAFLVMFLYQLGEYFQEIAVNNSRKDISKLVELKSEIAHKFDGDKVIDISPSQLKIDDIIVIKAGEKVPTDSIIIDGISSFDTKSLTGEAEPKICQAGDEILSGFNNINQIIKAKVVRLEEDSAIAKVLNLVENSMDKKGKADKFITKFAKIYTPIVTLIAFIIFLVGIFITIFSDQNLIVDFTLRALKVLVISCPCALVISVPLTYFGAIGALAKRGILVKGANNLDAILKAKDIYFDKTGTLTYGNFYIKEFKSNDLELMELISSSLEANSPHPIASVFKDKKKLEVEDYKEEIGLGISGKIDHKLALIGNQKLMDKYGIKADLVLANDTILLVAYDNKYLGYYLVADKHRENINQVFSDLKNNGLDKIILLTGDNDKKAQDFSANYQFDEVHSDLLPEDKYALLDKNGSDKAIYVGDGINDAPVMSLANTSFSMGKLASDIAIENSDIVLINEDLDDINKTLKIAKKNRLIIIENIVFSILVKVILMVLGAIGVIPLWSAVLGDVGVMLIAVLNSLRIKIGN